MFTPSDRVLSEITEQQSEPALDFSERGRTIQQIRELSPTATHAFLNRFNDRDLGSYLEHLQAAAVPRSRHARWVRKDECPAAVGRSSRW